MNEHVIHAVISQNESEPLVNVEHLAGARQVSHRLQRPHDALLIGMPLHLAQEMEQRAIE